MNSALLAQSSLRRTREGREQMGCVCVGVEAAEPAGRAERCDGAEGRRGLGSVPTTRPCGVPRVKGTGAEGAWQRIS